MNCPYPFADFEDPLYHRFGLAGADKGGRRLSADQKPQRLDEDRLPRPRFAGDDRKPGAEFHPDLVDQGEIFDKEFEEHKIDNPSLILPLM